MTDRIIITEEMIQKIANLAMLELSEQQKDMAKKDMTEMLGFLDKLNDLESEGIEPMLHLFPVTNVFREDLADDDRDKTKNKKSILMNAPQPHNGYFQVPKTVDT